MKIIKIESFENGARPALQDWNYTDLPEGFAWCPEEFESIFYSTNPSGFVNITVSNNAVTEMTVNQEALNAYIAEHPVEPDPVEPETENVTWDLMAEAINEGVNEV